MLFAILRQVFRNPQYIFIACTTTIVVLSIAILLPNTPFISALVRDDTIPIAAKLRIITHLLRGLWTNFSTLSSITTILSSLLFGITTALFVFILHARTHPTKKSVATGSSGLIAGALGIGCAACGSFVTSAILASIGATSAFALLPFHGAEFGFLSIMLLLLTISLLVKTIADNDKKTC